MRPFPLEGIKEPNSTPELDDWYEEDVDHFDNTVDYEPFDDEDLY